MRLCLSIPSRFSAIFHIESAITCLDWAQPRTFVNRSCYHLLLAPSATFCQPTLPPTRPIALLLPYHTPSAAQFASNEGLFPAASACLPCHSAVASCLVHLQRGLVPGHPACPATLPHPLAGPTRLHQPITCHRRRLHALPPCCNFLPAQFTSNEAHYPCLPWNPHPPDATCLPSLFPPASVALFFRACFLSKLKIKMLISFRETTGLCFIVPLCQIGVITSNVISYVAL
jgi:hypothetical protein